MPRLLRDGVPAWARAFTPENRDVAMTDSLMTRCETKRLYKIDGKKEWRWVEVAVTDLADEGEREIRCAHCHGAVKINRRKGERGAEDHVKHRSRADADNCQDGRGVQSGHGLSSKPVE